MKALSGYAEFFWLMAINIKDIENRKWPLSRYFEPAELPVRIYLHASRTAINWEAAEFIAARLTDRQMLDFRAVNWPHYRGKFIGEITVTGEAAASSSPWAVEGQHHFMVKDGVLYDTPVPFRGQLGFFEVGVIGDNSTILD